jgi:hypothetical protein
MARNTLHANSLFIAKVAVDGWTVSGYTLFLGQSYVIFDIPDALFIT